MFGRSYRIRRTRRGIELSLDRDEVEVLANLTVQLRDALLAGDEPDLRRLFPVAYPDRPERDDEYRAMVHDVLLEGRLANLEQLESTLESRKLSEEQLAAWMGALNDLRLVLGTRLDVSEEDSPIDPDDPDAPAWVVYRYLGGLLEEAVQAAMGGLEAGGSDAES